MKRINIIFHSFRCLRNNSFGDRTIWNVLYKIDWKHDKTPNMLQKYYGKV
jgi:hypothetical protein